MKPLQPLLKNLFVAQAVLFCTAEVNSALAKQSGRGLHHHAAFHSHDAGGQAGGHGDVARKLRADDGAKDAAVGRAAAEAHRPETETIDVSVTTTRNPFWFRHMAKAHHGQQANDWSKAGIATGWTGPRSHRHDMAADKRDPGAKRKELLTTNAIGLHVHKASLDRDAKPLDGADQSVARSAAKDAGPVDGGNAAPAGRAPPREGFVPATPNGHLSHYPSLNTAMNPAVIDGRDMVRPAFGAGAIGGAPRKVAAGVISGSDYHPRHP